MKKIFMLSFLVFYVFSACCAGAAEVGVLSKANATEEQFSKLLTNDRLILSEVFADGIEASDINIHFYNSIIEMMLSLNRGEIDAVMCPIFFGEYALKHNPEYTLKGLVIGRVPLALSFGFLEEKADLQKRFNDALTDMNDGALSLLLRDYVTGPKADTPPAVKFEHFDDAETINIAVTGDLPPIDYIAADGTPAGFNTALLAEIGRRLHVNINPVNVETGARMSALKSGRVDVVFWFQSNVNPSIPNLDVPEGVILSEPYYQWNEQYFIGKK